MVTIYQHPRDPKMINKTIILSLTSKPVNIIEQCFLSAIQMNKFNALYDMLNNPFYSSKVKTRLDHQFYFIQKYNNAFKRFVYRWKHTRINTFNNNQDLLLNSLDNYKPTQRISLVENNTRYDFCLNDLLKIIHNALLYHDNLFSKPSCPKNPYTNLPFGIHNLYNIYFHMLHSIQIIPQCFYLFFLSNFNIPDFVVSNEPYLRDESIKSYYNDIPTEEHYQDILGMLNVYAKYVPNIIIHAKCSKQLIINAFKDISVEYLLVQYSYSPKKMAQSSKNIKQFLITFNTFNPKFGRITYRIHQPSASTEPFQ